MRGRLERPVRGEQARGALRFVAAGDSVAAPSSEAQPETLRASTRTVLHLGVRVVHEQLVGASRRRR
ncbi:MAG: hypothetical protein ICV73_07080 [Acetobacteraceae bacterium]|nr:hypothetical protein [Acetobacteraceae bacterium]